MSKKSQALQDADAAVLRSLMDQRRQRFLFNVPQPRLDLVSPYPAATRAATDMRRKAEILARSGPSGSGSGGAGLTKRAAWAALARSGRASALSQTAIADYVAAGAVCPANKLLPTLTTACDVPGPAMLLYLDPAVPLYAYADGVSRTFATQSVVDAAALRLDTKNELDFLARASEYLLPDAAGGARVADEPVGAILMNPLGCEPATAFALSFPLALWLAGVQYNPVQDTSEYNGAYVAAHATSELSLALRVSAITVAVYYNTTLVSSTAVSATAIAALAQPALPVQSFDNGFYAMQYVGMVAVPAFSLATQPGDVFSVRASVSYSYNTAAALQIRVLQTGAFANVGAGNVSHAINCAFAADAPADYAAGSFVFYPDTYINARLPV